MQAFEKHSSVLLAIIYFIFANSGVAGHWRVDLNQALQWKIQRSGNTTADPCKDFYEYSCGNFNGYGSGDENVGEITQYLDKNFDAKLMEIFKAEPSVDDNKYSNGRSVVAFVLEVCAHALNHLLKATNPLRSVCYEIRAQTFREKSQNYYAACVKENRTNFRNYFEELQIKWPLLAAQYETAEGFSSKDFWQSLGQLQSYNWNNLIIQHEITATKDATLNIILAPAYNKQQVNLPDDLALESILKALKVNNTWEIVQQLKATEQMWWEIFQNHTGSSEYTYTAITWKEASQRYPFLVLYLQQLLAGKIDKIASIMLRNVQFFNHLAEIQWSSEEWQRQLNYLMLHFIFYLFEDSSPEFTAQSCIKDLRNKLDLAVNYMYYEKNIPEEQSLYRDRLSAMKAKIECVMLEFFGENNLNLTAPQVRALKKKLHGIRFNLGNLPQPLSGKKIEKFYQDVPDLDSRNYFKNHLLLLQHRFRKTLVYQEELDFYIIPDNSLASSSSLFYAPKQNLVIIPFASLQYPLYHFSFSALYQLSLMAFLIGHEMAHAFDSNGLTASNDYAITQQKFYNKSLECLQNQKATEDIDERIADLFGERVAYRIYEKYYYAGHCVYCQRQFYISMAQFFCNKGDLEFIDHDSDAVRLHQIVKNSRVFARAFNCPLNSPMNPAEKCRLY